MMLSHPVILGFVWSLLLQCSSGQPQISSQETNKVYAYSYHIQHNGTTNSQDILRRVLGGADPEFGGPSDDHSIVRTFSSPNIRGFFTKGVLPAGPSSYNNNPGLEDIKKVVEANIQPPRDIASGLLPPVVSPDIVSGFAGGYNNNDIGLNFQKQDDFPKIPPPPPPFSPPRVPEIDFPSIPDPPQPLIPDNGVSKVETFSRDTPGGGKVEGQIETFSYNPQPVSNSNSNYQENAHGFRRSENFVNSNQGVTGHRTQTYFRQQFRTVTPNLETNSLYNQNSRIDANLRNNNNNNNNQWWNVLNVLGENNNRNNHNTNNLGNQVERNINEVKSNLNNQLNTVFGSRLSGGVNNRRNNYNQNRQTVVPQNNGHNNNINIPNFNNRNFRNQPDPAVIPFSNRIDSNNNNAYNNQPANNYNNNNNRQNANIPFRNRQTNNGYTNSNSLNDKFNNDGTTKEVLDIINNVNNQLGNFNNAGNRPNLRLTWDDDVTPNIPNFNSDWSRRQSRGNGRPFSNAHSGPLNVPVGPNPVEALKSTLEKIVGGRDYQIPAVPDLGNRGGNYRNAGGGGVEKFFGVDKVVEGPNSYSRNQHRGFERNFHVDSNTGYQRSNQWSTNTLRRLDAQSSRNDFSKDFIDVFRDDY